MSTKFVACSPAFGTSVNNRLAPARPVAAPENPPRPPGSWWGSRSFEGDRALEVSAGRVANLETLIAIATEVEGTERLTKNVVVGAVLSIIFWFPAAILVAVLYRFPIPLGGYAHGASNLALVPLAVVFYGVIGGFVPVAVAGSLGGWWWTRNSRNNGASAKKRIWMTSAAVAVLAAIFPAILEEFIGPW